MTDSIITPETFSPVTVPGPKILLVGKTGDGKTHTIRTLVEAGLEVFVLFTEPGMEILSDIPSSKLHWHYIPPASVGWDELLDASKKINIMSYKALSNLEDMNKRKYKEWIDVLTVLSNFKCQRTGEEFGPVDLWGRSPPKEEALIPHWKAMTEKYNLNAANGYGIERALVIDSLSGLNVMSMNLVVGSKPTKAQPDWGMAMDNLERLITKLTGDVICPMAMMAHAEREQDEVTGGSSIMVSTLGRKLAPRIPRFFSDVIHVKREGTKFSWSTTTFGMELKARNLPYADSLPPTFVPIINDWRKARSEKVDSGSNLKSS